LKPSREDIITESRRRKLDLAHEREGIRVAVPCQLCGVRVQDLDAHRQAFHPVPRGQTILLLVDLGYVWAGVVLALGYGVVKNMVKIVIGRLKEWKR